MAGPDMSGLISQIAVGGVVIAVVAIAGALAVVFVARSGAGQFLRMLKDQNDERGRLQKFERKYRERREYSDWHRERVARDRKLEREHQAWRKMHKL